MTFSERYRLVRSKWNEDWWSIAFGGPIGNLLLALVADVPWITPNRITWLGFLCRLAAGPLLLCRSGGADLAAVALLQANVIFDCMDGSLARYRRLSSVWGSFLDKVSDLIGLFCVMALVGWRVYLDSGDALAIVIALLCGASIGVRGYVFWVVAALERDRRVDKPSAGVDQRLDYSAMSLRERARLYLRSMPRILGFSEADLYFWLGLGILLGRLREATYLLGVGMGLSFCAVLFMRVRTVLQLERSQAPR